MDDDGDEAELPVAWLEACDEAIAVGMAPEVGPLADDSKSLDGIVDLLHRLAAFRPGATRLGPEDGPADFGRWGTLARSFGDYELLELVAQGGMGVVFKARQKSLNRIVALKMVDRCLLPSPAENRRFQFEAEAIAMLEHRNIVPIHEVGRVGDRSFFSMKWMEGGNLEGLVSAEVKDAKLTARLIAEVADAVHHAHLHGFMHRDLKPANILLDTEGHAHVCDFGLARRLEGESSLTQTGAIVGTPSYMSPEQAQGTDGGHTASSDIYSLGAILYATLTGEPPFRGESPVETLRRVVDDEPCPPSRVRPGIDRDLESICLKAIRKDPRHRYDSALAMADDLRRWLGGEPIHAKDISLRERTWKWTRRHPAIAGLVTLLAVVTSIGLIAMARLYAGAVAARSAAVAALRDAESSLYSNAIALAFRHHQAHDSDRADAILDGCPVPFRDWEWRYLKRCSTEKPTIDAGDGHGIRAVVYSPDGRYLVTVDSSKKVHVRDRSTSRIFDLPGLAGQSAAAAFSPDGLTLAVCGSQADGLTASFALWDTASWKSTRRREIRGLTSTSTSIAVSPDGRRIVTGHDDDLVRVWDLDDDRVSPLLGHSKRVEDVAFSPDGRSFASASRDGTVRLWDARSFRTLGVLRHDRAVFAVAFHPTRPILASATGDVVYSSRGDLTLWDLGTQREVRKASHLASMMTGVRFSPDGRRMVTAGWDHLIRIWDAATLEELLPLAGHTGPVRAVAFSIDGNEIVSGSHDGTLRIWDARPLPPKSTHRPLRTLAGHRLPIFAMGLTRDGRNLITAGEDRKAVVWDLRTGTRTASYEGHRHAVTAVAIRPDGGLVATGGDDMLVHLWNPRTGVEESRLPGHTVSISSLAFHPNGVWLASSSQDGTVRLWDTATGQHLHEFIKSDRPMTALAFSPDGNHLAAGTDGGAIYVWFARTHERLAELKGHTGRVVRLDYHPGSDRLLSTSLDGSVRLWSSLAGREIERFDGARGHGLAWTPDGRHFAVSGAGGSMKMYEATSGRRVLDLQGHLDEITGIAFTPDGREVITSSWDHSIKVWPVLPDAPDLGAGEVRRLVGYVTHASTAAFLPDGRRAISGGEDGRVHVWDLKAGRELRQWQASDFKVFNLALTSDGHRVVVVGERTQARVYDIESGSELRRFHHHNGAVFGLAVAPDGRHALMGSVFRSTDRGWELESDADPHLWDLETGLMTRRFSGCKAGTVSVAISSDGRTAASGGTDGTIQIWDLASGRQTHRIEGHPGFWVKTVGFLGDGKRLISGGDDNLIRIWDVESGVETRRFEGSQGPVDCISSTPDGRRAISAGLGEGMLHFWDLDSGHEVYRIDASRIGVARGSISDDGRRVLWACLDGTVRLWNLAP